MKIRIRPATSADIPVLRDLIEASVRGLQSNDYSPSQIDSALASVFGVDTQLIADRTYFVAEAESYAGATVPVVEGAAPPFSIVGCGGWSKRKTLYGGDQWTGREATFLDPQRDAAKIRAFFTHPAWARRGIGSMILEACENAAQATGFTRFEMGRHSHRSPPLPGPRLRRSGESRGSVGQRRNSAHRSHGKTCPRAAHGVSNLERSLALAGSDSGDTTQCNCRNPAQRL